MAVTNSTIDMTWTAATDNVGVVSYHIYQSTDNVVYTEINSTDGVTYAYTATGLNPDTKYYFKQTAKDAAGNESLYGNTVEATTLGGVGYTYLLDDYPGAAAAYSLRRLRTGEVNAVEVRRDGASPSTTNVLLYDDPNKSIDLLSEVTAGGPLGDWANTDSVFVSVWYDQSGNGVDATQTTNTSQPRLINAGALEAENGLSTIKFGTTAATELLSPYVGTNSISAFTVLTTVVAGRIINFTDANRGMRVGSATAYINVINDIIIIGGAIVRGQTLYSWHEIGTNNITYYQGIAGGSLVNSNGFGNGSLIIGNNTADSYHQGNHQELIFYDSNQESNRIEIETNINEHYNIWVVTAEVDAQLIQADNDNVSDTVIEINGVRSSVSDTAVANLISRNVTVITN